MRRQFRRPRRSRPGCADRRGADESAADARGDAARQLRVAGLKAHCGPDAARPDRLHRNDHAAGQRHTAAVQRIGFDRVDLPLRPPAPDQFARRAEKMPPSTGTESARTGSSDSRADSRSPCCRWKNIHEGDRPRGPWRRRPGRRSRRPAPPSPIRLVPAPAPARAGAVGFRDRVAALAVNGSPQGAYRCIDANPRHAGSVTGHCQRTRRRARGPCDASPIQVKPCRHSELSFSRSASYLNWQRKRSRPERAVTAFDFRARAKTGTPDRTRR